MPDMTPIKLATVKLELAYSVEEATQFMWAEFEGDWETAERYYAGGTDLPSVEGRSNAVKTETRDLIRSIVPSIMRVLYQSRKPVEFQPGSIASAAFVEQQSVFINQLFKRYGGYSVLSDAVLHSLVCKAGPVKVFWEENPRPEPYTATGLTIYEVDDLKMSDDIEVLEVTKRPYPKEGNEAATDAENIQYLKSVEEMPDLYDVKCVKYHYNGKIRFEAFPIYEFFCSRSATSTTEAFVHGHRRQVTVAEAIELGLESSNWGQYSDNDPETDRNSGSSTARRGYSAYDAEDTESEDPLKQTFLLTECYCEYDLKGVGYLQKYCFWLGGESYTYIDHEEIDDYCIDLVIPDRVPFTFMGRSIADITVPMQDDSTSIFRAVIDNAHIANNPRLSADPTMVDFSDLMNNAIGAPIKARNGSVVNQVDIPFTGGSLLPFLEYLEKDAEERVGVTKAATGLDPSALQSTDKEAVRNTIQMSQGQIELMVRNIVETGLIPLFRKALRLSISHMDRAQIIKHKGKVIPVDLLTFDPDLVAEPKVGLGNADAEQKAMTLQFIMGKQEQILQTMGMNNPFTSLSLLYNTIEDLVELGGVHDVGRYFTEVTKDVEEELRAKQDAEAKAAAEAEQKLDPQEAFIKVEQLKAQIREKELQIKAADGQERHQLEREKLALEGRKLAIDAERFASDADLKRDELVQERKIEVAKLGKEYLDDLIAKEQEGNNDDTDNITRIGTGSTTPRPK